MQRTIFESEHEMFRDAVAQFVERHIVPNIERWERAGIVDRELFRRAGESGFLATGIPTEYGGGGVVDFRYNQIFSEEMQRVGAGGISVGLTLQSDVCLPYFTSFATEEQRHRWIPGLASGDLICALAMTEPATGSDLAGISTTAIRQGAHYVVNGSKTFISNGINADVVIVAAKTDPSLRHGGLSLLLVERGMRGFERGRNLEKLGLHSQDTAELFFSDVEVPVENLLGAAEGAGFQQMVANLPQERLSIAVTAVGAARAALSWTTSYCRDRCAFGASIGSFQAVRFAVAEMHADVEIATQFIDQCVVAHNQGRLSAEDAAIAKWRSSEVQQRTVDVGLQLHGGNGFMMEYPIARAYADARVSRIFGGTTEIMKEIVGRQVLGKLT